MAAAGYGPGPAEGRPSFPGGSHLGRGSGGRKQEAEAVSGILILAAAKRGRGDFICRLELVTDGEEESDS